MSANFADPIQIQFIRINHMYIIIKILAHTTISQICVLAYIPFIDFSEWPFDIYGGRGQKITREANFFSGIPEKQTFFPKNNHIMHDIL